MTVFNNKFLELLTNLTKLLMNHNLNYTAMADINLTNTGQTLILYNSKILNFRKPLILYTDHHDG